MVMMVLSIRISLILHFLVQILDFVVSPPFEKSIVVFLQVEVEWTKSSFFGRHNSSVNQKRKSSSSENATSCIQSNSTIVERCIGSIV